MRLVNYLKESIQETYIDPLKDQQSAYIFNDFLDQSVIKEVLLKDPYKV